MAVSNGAQSNTLHQLSGISTSIYDHIALDSPTAADKFVTELTLDLARIADLGVSGVARDWILPGLRLHVFGRYSTYFWYDNDYLMVSRIVHGARDLERNPFDQDFGD